TPEPITSTPPLLGIRRRLPLGTRVAREIAASPREGVVSYDRPSGWRAVVTTDQVRYHLRPNGAHVLGERPEVLIRQDPRRHQAVARRQSDALVEVKLGESGPSQPGKILHSRKVQ